MPIVRINEFSASEGKNEELHHFLCSLKDYISHSPGCLSYQVLTHHSETNKFLVIEHWQDIDAHTLSVEKFPKAEMQAAMALIGSPPIGNYYTL